MADSADNREFDVILCAADGTRICAQRDILVKSSRLFEDLFSLELTGEEDIPVNFVSSSVLTDVIEYCYTGNVTIHNMNNLMEMAGYFQLTDSTVDKCLEVMKNNLCVENCMNFIIFAERRGLKKLIRSSMEFIDLFFDLMWMDDKFNQISVSTLQLILERDTLEVKSEKFVFDAILKWYKYDKGNRRQYLPKLLKLVRLSDLDQTFIASIFLDFCASHDCVEVSQIASGFLTQDVDSVRWTSDSRMADKIVAFDEKTIQAYIQKRKKWTQFTHICDKLKLVAYEDRWMDGIEYFHPIFSDGYLSGVKKIQLTTRQTIVEHKLSYKMNRLLSAKWIEGDNSIFYAAGYDTNYSQTLDDDFPIRLSIIQYDARNNKWTNLTEILQRINFFHIVYLDGYLYVLEECCIQRKTNETVELCRFNVATKSWEHCENRRSWQKPISIKYSVGVLNGSIYMVDTLSNTPTAKCFDTKTMSWRCVTPLSQPCKNMKLCGAKLFLYAVTDEESDTVPEKSEKRVFQYNPKENKWMEVDSLHSIADDFQLINASNFV